MKWNTLYRRTVAACLIAFAASAVAADTSRIATDSSPTKNALGHWHGTLQTPSGGMALELNIYQPATGPIAATLESMAAYLASVGSDPAAVQQRRPPVLGAGQQPAPGETATARTPASGPPAGEQSDAGNGQAAGEKDKAAGTRARRPSESIEFGLASGPAEDSVSVASPQSALPGAGKVGSKLEIEE